MIKFKVLIFVILVQINLAKSQDIVIKGRISNNVNLGIAYCNVNLINKSDSLIFTYTQTNKVGDFSLILPKNLKLVSNYLIQINSLGYFLKSVDLVASQTIYNIVLESNAIPLKEIIVKNFRPVVKISGDTTSYRVDDFASLQDRTIGDVLKKIPGITIEENGRIKFNGQNVGKLLLDGDDLLESKYNIAISSLPNNIVNQIQVLENHQSIKALEGKVFSDEININLTFKDKAKLKIFGQALVGGGFPALYEEDANLISLKNNYKAIYNLKGNNTGISLANDIQSLNLLQEIAKKGYNPTNSQLSIGLGNNPPINQNRYLFNNSGLLNGANLFKLKQNVQLKSKVYYNYDNEKQLYQSINNIFLPNENIEFTENQIIQNKPKNVYADLIIFENKSEFYLNNKFAFSGDYKDQTSELITNGSNWFQSYNYISKSISNEFDLVKSPKGKIITQLYSYLNYQTQPENLNIDSGNYEFLFNSIQNLKNISQNVRIPTLFINNYALIQTGGTHFTQSYKVGTSINHQKYQTELQALSNQNNETYFADSGINKLGWKEYKLFIEPTFEWRYGNFRLITKTPIKYQIINSNDYLNSFLIKKNNLLINENISLRYNKEKGISTTFYYVKTASAGDFLQSHQAIILNNYRSYSVNDDVFITSKRQNFGFLVNYKNPVKLLFMNLSAYHQNDHYNTISYRLVNQNLSFEEREILDNRVYSNNLRSDFSKYIFSIKSTYTISFGIQSSTRQQFVNNLLYPFLFNSKSLSLVWNGTIINKFRYSYLFNYQNSISKTKSEDLPIKSFEVQSTKQTLGFEYDFNEDFFIKSDNYLLTNSNNNGLKTSYLFVDFSVRYKLRKHKIDFCLETRNLTNIKDFVITASTLNVQTNNSYPLRERMILLKAQFNF